MPELEDLPAKRGKMTQIKNRNWTTDFTDGTDKKQEMRAAKAKETSTVQKHN